MKRSFLLLVLLIVFAQCQTLPKGYLKDEKVVFLKQNPLLEPILYAPRRAEPYKFLARPKVNAKEPTFLRIQSFSETLKPDFYADARLYEEVKQHIKHILESPKFRGLKALLMNEDVKKLTNGIYSENSDGKLVKLESSGSSPNQFQYRPANSNYQYVYFLDDTFVNVSTSAVIFDNNLRFSFQTDNQLVSVYGSSEMIVVTPDYKKTHHRFDAGTLTQKQVLSYFFPEGVQISGIDSEKTSTKFNPKWPEQYLQKQIGSFSFAYTKADEKYLSKIDNKKLSYIKNLVQKQTGLSTSSTIYVVLPPNLTSFSKIHALQPETLNWYPSGFQLKNLIIMWPPSVPRYEDPRGEKYFWSDEFYDILLHEVTHLIIAENTGTFSPLPVWLNEGLAVTVECEYSPLAKTYWETTFNGHVILNQFLPWDDITIKSTSAYAVAQARTHYVQSYKMVEYLLKKYGSAKMASFIKSFKINPTNQTDPTSAWQQLKEVNEQNFATVFGTSWQENIKAFEAANHIKEKGK